MGFVAIIWIDVSLGLKKSSGGLETGGAEIHNGFSRVGLTFLGETMDYKTRVDIFINVHKGLRLGLLSLALKIGRMDWSDEEEVKSVGEEFATLLHFLREHAINEDEIQFPLLESRAPSITQKDRREHRKLEKALNQLEKDWVGILSNPDRSKLGYQFYLAYNRFLSGYLAHMDREENDVTAAFYKNFADPEIEAGFQKIIARTPLADVIMMMEYMIPAMNGDERYTFLSKLKASAPPEAYRQIKDLSQKVLAHRDWQKLSARLG
jgi:hemerythrin-like domain-containing protein